jgi:hypothetical protein
MDLPEDEYKLTLKNFLNNVNQAGFDMFYKDWNSASYTKVIQGLKWITKYNESKQVTHMNQSREVHPSIYAFALTGTVNMLAFFYVWATFLTTAI